MSRPPPPVLRQPFSHSPARHHFLRREIPALRSASPQARGGTDGQIRPHPAARRARSDLASPPPSNASRGLDATDRASQETDDPVQSSPAMAMAVIRLARPAAAIRPPSAASAASPSLRPATRLRVRVVRCRAGGGEGGKKEEEGEAEAPESLFARELRRRGMAPGVSATPAGAKEAEEGAAPEAGANRRVAAAEFERGAAADGQRERSMALNSEGLEVRFLSHSFSLSRARAILIGHAQSLAFS